MNRYFQSIAFGPAFAPQGLFDRSSSSNVTNLTDATTTNTTQTDQSGGSLNFSDVGGGLSVALTSNESLSNYESTSNSTNNYTTDQGAIAAGLELGRSGIKAAFDSLASFGKLSGDSLATVRAVNADSLNMLAGLASGAIDASKTIARDSANSNADFLSQAVAGFGSLAKQTSEGSDDKIARVVGFALLAVAAVVIGPALFKSGGKAVIA